MIAAVQQMYAITHAATSLLIAYLFLLYFDTRAGYGDTGPYAVPGQPGQSVLVRDFYRLNHRHPTYDFVRDKKRELLRLDRRRMTVLEALDFLDTLVDDSDPDISLSQREHLLQSAEAIDRGGARRTLDRLVSVSTAATLASGGSA